jgi:DNA gyrase/topoisomerase IV subunit A
MGIRKKSIVSEKQLKVTDTKEEQPEIEDKQEIDSLEITEKDTKPPKIKKERSELQREQFKKVRAIRLAQLAELKSQKAERELNKRVNHLEQKALKVLTKKNEVIDKIKDLKRATKREITPPRCQIPPPSPRYETPIPSQRYMQPTPQQKYINLAFC